MKAYKGFNTDMTCRDFQYEEGKSFHTEKAECCKEGFHACEYPLDCLKYYVPSESVYHEVDLSGDIDKETSDTKVCCTDIKIGARISIAGLVEAAINFTKKRVHKASSATGDCGASSATGYCGKAEVKDSESIAVAWGYHGRARGVKGSFLVFADWEGNEEKYYTQTEWSLKGAKMVRVDGEKIKENIWYTMKNDEIVEVQE